MRLQWASTEIEKLWGARLSRIQDMLFQVELDSIGELLGRKGALITLQSGSEAWFRLPSRLYVVPIGISKLEDYSNGVKWPAIGEPFCVRSLVTKVAVSIPTTNKDWGHLLGYPSCCIQFFEKTWATGETDTMLAQAHALLPDVEQPVNTTHNITLKSIGIRPVFHLPCSYDCAGTAEIAAYHKKLANDQEAWKWMEEILGTPYKITVNKGIAEIIHPLFRACYETVLPNSTVSFVTSVLPVNTYDTFWKDNGFSDYFSMMSAHQNIINEIVGLTAGSILDLGAGNGLLLATLGRILNPTKLIAVEQDLSKVERGRKLFPNVTFIGSRIQDYLVSTGLADLVLISVNRYDEGIDQKLVSRLTGSHIVIYSYDRDIGSILIDNFVRIPTKHRRVHIYKRKP